MAYDDVIERGLAPTYPTSSGAQALIPEDAAREIIKGATVQSAAMQLFTKRRMSRAQTRLPVVSALPTAYWVSGDTGLKQTTDVNWNNRFLNAEELAVIVPIPEKVLDDVDYDLWAEIRPLIEEAIAVALDEAIFFGVNKPASWPDDIKTAALAAGNSVAAGTAAAVDIAEDINQMMATVEADGFDINGFWGRTQLKAALRGLRDTQKQPIFNSPLRGLQNVEASPELYNEKIIFSKAGFAEFTGPAADTRVSMIGGDWKQGILGIRQDLTFKKLDQAALFNGAGGLVYNLPQQDMIAMRVVCRYAWQVPNPLNRMNQTATRYPFGVLTQKAGTPGLG